MNTYPLLNDKNKIFAFEFRNIYISPREISKLLAKHHSISDIKLRKWFNGSPDIHLKFKFNQRECMVWEAFGDSDMYWVGALEDSKNFDASELEEIFKSYRVPIFRKIMAYVLYQYF